MSNGLRRHAALAATSILMLAASGCTSAGEEALGGGCRIRAGDLPGLAHGVRDQPDHDPRADG